MPKTLETRRTPQQIKRDLKLKNPPSKRFMELLEQVGDSPYVDLDLQAHGRRTVGLLKGTTPEQIRQDLSDALVARTIGDLLEAARKQSGLTMQALGDAMGVSRGRINQLEQLGAKPELSTLHRFAKAIQAELLIRSVGEGLEVALIPRDQQKKPLVVRV